jgi:hypothetical protein
MMRTFVTTLAAVLALLPVAAVAQVAPGTTLNGTIQQDINTASATVGQPVVLTNVASANGSGAIVGARLAGEITDVQRAGQGRPAKLQMRFDRLRLPDGRVYQVDGVVTGTAAQTKNNALKEVGGAVVGMLVGNALGKTIGLNGGGIVGAGGGYLLAKNNRQNMTISAGSVVTVRIDSARRQAR